MTESGSQGEANALRGGSANIAAIRLRRMINEAQSFYSRAGGDPFDVYEMVGDDNAEAGRLCIIDLQGLSNTARQVIVALISSELMKAAADKQRRPDRCSLSTRKGTTCTRGEAAISKNVIKRIAAEGRKFGVGFAIVSQRPSKLDSDVTSQCNTIVAMRIKNPDDQRFIQKTSDYFSAADLAELPTLSTGEALICGRAIIAPLVVKVGTKALIHGGESPRVCERWGGSGGCESPLDITGGPGVRRARQSRTDGRALPDVAVGDPGHRAHGALALPNGLGHRGAVAGLLRRGGVPDLVGSRQPPRGRARGLRVVREALGRSLARVRIREVRAR